MEDVPPPPCRLPPGRLLPEGGSDRVVHELKWLSLAPVLPHGALTYMVRGGNELELDSPGQDKIESRIRNSKLQITNSIIELQIQTPTPTPDTELQNSIFRDSKTPDFWSQVDSNSKAGDRPESKTGVDSRFSGGKRQLQIRNSELHCEYSRLCSTPELQGGGPDSQVRTPESQVRTPDSPCPRSRISAGPNSRDAVLRS